MPALKKSSLKSSIETLGVIAGGGKLPARLLKACDASGIEPFIVGFEGQTDPQLIEGRNHVWTRLGAAGDMIKTLKSHGIEHLSLIGSIRRPSLAELRPDFKTIQFFAKVGLKALGDSDLLSALRKELEAEGFQIHAVQEFASDLLAAEGPVGKFQPQEADWSDIERGIEVSQELGVRDVGQAAIVQEGIVLGVECVEGTDELIRRCIPLKRKGRGGVLVKTCKPQQDTALDLPTIGPDTVENAARAELAGIVVQAGKSLIVDTQMVAEIADRHRMFVLGITINR